MAAATLCMALYNVWSRPYIGRSSALGFLTAGMAVGGGALVVVSVLSGGAARRSPGSGPASGIAALYLAAGGGALAFFLWVYALQHASPTRVANTMTVNPLVAGLLAAVLLDEPFTLNLVIGLARGVRRHLDRDDGWQQRCGVDAPPESLILGACLLRGVAARGARGRPAGATMTLKIDGTLLLAGAGNMGAALLAGWLERGLDPAHILVQDPAPPPRAKELLDRHGIAAQATVDALPEPPAVIVVAVKPQVMDEVFPAAGEAGREKDGRSFHRRRAHHRRLRAASCRRAQR